MATSTYSSAGAKLGTHHLAYLRAIAEGVPQRLAAARYLAHEAGDGSVSLRKAHNAIVDRLRAIARRQGDPRWRLIGLSIRPHESGEQRPPIDRWSEERGFESFSQAELLELYKEQFPTDRKAQRNSRLRARQLELLQALTPSAAEPALPHHRLDDWFPQHLCRSLMASGLLLLADLQARVRAGGRWWRAIPRIGVGKAERLEQHLEVLLPGSTAPRRSGALALRGGELAASIARPQPGTAPIAPPPASAANRPAHPGADAAQAAPRPASTSEFDLPPELPAATDLRADAQAVRAWIRARAGSDATAKSYRRELGRFLLFLDRRGLTLSRCGDDDCRAYLVLLQDVPQDWKGKRSAPLGHETWSPFAGPLSRRSQQHAIVVVRACFAWLVAAGYLPANPWALVERSPGDDHSADSSTRLVLPPRTWRSIVDSLERLTTGQPAAQRMLFLLQFLDATGLRAAELLGARLGDFSWRGGSLQLQVHGRSRRGRLIAVADPARQALQRYLASRGLEPGAIESQPQAPLLASVKNPDAALTYRSLYGSMKTWLNKAIEASGLSGADKVDAARASPQWLRHRCGARALAQGVPVQVVGQLLGHAARRTTKKYATAQGRAVADGIDAALG